MKAFANMGIKSFVNKTFRRSKTVLPRICNIAGAFGLGAFTSGETLGVSTAYRCIRLLADSVATLPLLVLKKRGEVFTEDSTSALSSLLNLAPTDGINAHDFWTLAIQRILTNGNAYAVIVYDAPTDAYPSRIIPVSSATYDRATDTYSVEDSDAGICGVFESSQILHFKNLTLDGVNGVGVITFARSTLDIANAAAVETLDRFKNGGIIRGIISNDTSVKGFGEYSDAALQSAADKLESSVRQGSRILYTPGDCKFTPMAMSASDMQFISALGFNVREICRFFGVHPSFVFDDTSNNYKSAEMANVAFLSNTLNPLLVKIEQELNRKLIGVRSARTRRIAFDRRELYACDLESRAKWHAQMLANGTHSVNEIRKSENLPPVEGGDITLVTANLKSIKDFSTTQE